MSLPSFVDVMILGSGFGGAVLAARLGAAAQALGKKVLVVEKGLDHTGRFDSDANDGPFNAQGNRFKHALGPDYLATLLDVASDPSGAFKKGASSMNVASGRGLGGGSNVYDAVSLRAPTEVFEQTTDAGRRLWPGLYTRAALDPYYASVEARLKVQRLAWTTDGGAPHWALATKRDWVFAEGCRRIGATATPLKVATHDDANEGWWNQGQRFQGRQDLTKNYLQDAKDAGVAFATSCEVRNVAPSAKGYVVTGTDRRGGSAVDFTIECKMLVVACGAVASTGLLLRSEDAFKGARTLDPSGALGRHLSANGDYGVTGIVGDKFERDVEGFKGKPMSSFSPSFWAKDKFILIPFYAAPLHLAFGQPSTLLRAADPSARGRGSAKARAGERDFGLDYKKRLARFGSKMLTMGCLALDACEGEIRLGDADAPEVRWPTTHERTEARWTAAVSAMARIYEALGGEMYLDTYRRDGSVNTAHPLGGCRMTDDPEKDGVVGPLGEALMNPNLFVVDGASIPSALGVNPSLTIAAVAELVADRLIRGVGTTRLADRLA